MEQRKTQKAQPQISDPALSVFFVFFALDDVALNTL